jgi:hypothetical protein
MLRRDFETFFLGTAMTISTTGRRHASPKNAAAALYRRGRRLSLAKTSHRRNKLASPPGFVFERGQAREGMSPLFRRALSTTVTVSWQHVLQLGPGPARVGLGSEGKLLSDNFADVEHISFEGLGGIGLSAQYGLAAFGIQIVGHVVLEDDAESIVEVLSDRIQCQHAGLHDPAPETPLDHDLTAQPAVDRHAGRKGRQAQKAKSLGKRGPFPFARHDVQGRATSPHTVDIDDSLNFRFVFLFSRLRHSSNLL